MNYQVFPQHSLLSNKFPNEISNLILEFIFKPQSYKKDINPLYQKFKIIQVINTTETEFDDYYQRYRNISYFKSDTYYYTFKKNLSLLLPLLKIHNSLKPLHLIHFIKNILMNFGKINILLIFVMILFKYNNYTLYKHILYLYYICLIIIY